MGGFPRDCTADQPQPPGPARVAGQAVLASWHELLDAGRMQDGEPYLAATAKRAVARLSAATAAEVGVTDGAPLSVRTDRGAITLPLAVTPMPDRVVWLPANSAGSPVRRSLGVDVGALVSLAPAQGGCHVTSLAWTQRRSTARHPRLASFGQDPWWVVGLKVLLIFGLLVVMVLFAIWAERRVIGRMQLRKGPNRAGPFGLLQSLADGIKLALKEDIIPQAADKVVYVIAPVISVIPAFMALAVIPFGPTVRVPFSDVTTPLQLTDLPVGVLYILAVASVGVYGIVLAGWASGSTYPLLGGLRSTAQVISYEIAMGLSFVTVFLLAGTMSTSGIVAAQQGTWFVVVLFPSFVVYAVSMVGETNRAPFDLPEAEGELVGGFHTEYSSLKFALFFLAEYVNMVVVSALATTLFLGGWRAPWPLSSGTAPTRAIGRCCGSWARSSRSCSSSCGCAGTLPRLRYDQFMRLGWKVLIPFQLVWIVAVAAMQLLPVASWTTGQRLLYFGGAAFVVLAVLFLLDVLTRGSAKAPAGDGEDRTDTSAISGDGRHGCAIRPLRGGLPRAAHARADPSPGPVTSRAAGGRARPDPAVERSTAGERGGAACLRPSTPSRGSV